MDDAGVGRLQDSVTIERAYVEGEPDEPPAEKTQEEGTGENPPKEEEGGK
jgi:hypothetical protein